MSIVLRSLLACTRATPSYQLSRKQSPDKYIICYKMYSGEPIVSHLGEHYSKKTIGNVVTPIGRFVLNVAYRTRLTMSSAQMDNSTTNAMTQFGIDMDDNHFSLVKNPHNIKEYDDFQVEKWWPKLSGHLTKKFCSFYFSKMKEGIGLRVLSCRRPMFLVCC